MKKAALITGAGQRIGRAIALDLAACGYAIAVHYNRSSRGADETLRMIKKAGGDGALFQANLADEQETLQLITEVKASYPALQVLINNASLFLPDRLTDQSKRESSSQLHHQIQVNALSPALLTSRFAALCETGQIINMLDSRVGRQDEAYFSYSLSKKMLREITLHSAAVLPPGFRVNGIAPGEILAPVHAPDSSDADRRAQISASIRLILENDYINGEILFIDGGARLR